MNQNIRGVRYGTLHNDNDGVGMSPVGIELGTASTVVASSLSSSSSEIESDVVDRSNMIINKMKQQPRNGSTRLNGSRKSRIPLLHEALRSTDRSSASTLAGHDDGTIHETTNRSQQQQQRRTESSQKRGVCNMLSILPISKDDDAGERVLVDQRVYNEASAWLAWYHVSTGIHPFLPDVQQRLASCQVEFRLSMRDSRFSMLGTAREFLNSFEEDFQGLNGNTTTTEGSSSDILSELDQYVDAVPTKPSVILGSARSADSTVLSFLSAAYGIPQISSSSTAAYLDNKGTHPLFSRTVPTNKGDAQAIAAYIGTYLQASHVGILYVGDDYGTNFHADLAKYMVAAGVNVFSVRYDDATISSAIQQLHDSGMRYIVAILNPSAWRDVLRSAVQMNIIGHPDYLWLLTESTLELVGPTFELDSTVDADLAHALHGTGLLSLAVPDNAGFDQAMLDFAESEELQQFYIQSHAEPDVFYNYTFPPPGRSLYQPLSYDAIIALALAVCEVPDDGEEEENEDAVAAGQRLYQQIVQTEFEGASGYVAFDPETGTRRSENLVYIVQNLLISENASTAEAYRFSSDVAARIDFSNPTMPVQATSVPFMYPGNGSTPPLALPPLDVDMNLVPSTVRVFGLTLCGTVIVISIGWMIWTLINRKKDVVRASQPIFLCILCVGTIITASSIIPMSLQEPVSERGLDAACMSVHWLISVGFVTAFSALFSKTWRLNKLFKHGRGMRRVIVRPQDVAYPFCILMALNLIVLIIWTVKAPVVWVRKEVSDYDQFGRSVQSVGTCQNSDSTGIIYISLNVAINFSVLIFTIYQAYLARNLPTEFSESSYIAVAMASLLEVLMLGMPLLFLGSDDPSASFFIRSVLVFLLCLCVLLPVFLPKFIQRNVNQRFQEAQSAATGSRVAPRLRITMNPGSSNGLGQSYSAAFVAPGPAPAPRTGSSSESQRHSSSGGGNGDSSDMSLPTTGTTKIRRNSEYFKERSTREANSSDRLHASGDSSDMSLPGSSTGTTKIRRNSEYFKERSSRESSSSDRFHP